MSGSGDWDDLRQTFTTSNGRKSIAPTQFNIRSTRGHCIMVLDVTIPVEGSSQPNRGRIYVCDLAGTEPAGDIFYANYDKKKMPDGTIEECNPQPHPDKQKTKELQSQGIKINQSLSEMSNFFRKMAEAVKKKTLKPGKSIPGCNSNFLCKYLKDTMLQARTYLFCGIRPEAHFLNYTFSTLGFAKNASVIKLAPKKAQAAMTVAEKKLMAKLDDMTAMVKKLQAEAAAGGGGGGGANNDAEMEKMRAELAAAKENVQQEDPEVLTHTSSTLRHYSTVALTPLPPPPPPPPPPGRQEACAGGGHEAAIGIPPHPRDPHAVL